MKTLMTGLAALAAITWGCGGAWHVHRQRHHHQSVLNRRNETKK
jgi:hypothetical protein